MVVLPVLICNAISKTQSVDWHAEKKKDENIELAQQKQSVVRR